MQSRITQEAITMNTFDAVGIAEGWIDRLAGARHPGNCFDTGLAWQLQGWFGRAASLIEHSPANRATQEA
jgi:hypothetical protein